MGEKARMSQVNFSPAARSIKSSISDSATGSGLGGAAGMTSGLRTLPDKDSVPSCWICFSVASRSTVLDLFLVEIALSLEKTSLGFPFLSFRLTPATLKMGLFLDLEELCLGPFPIFLCQAAWFSCRSESSNI